MSKIDFDKPHHCPKCHSRMAVWMPVLIEPGTDQVDTGLIDWESSQPQFNTNWTCGECGANDFPIEFEMVYQCGSFADNLAFAESLGWTEPDLDCGGLNVQNPEWTPEAADAIESAVESAAFEFIESKGYTIKWESTP